MLRYSNARLIRLVISTMLLWNAASISLPQSLPAGTDNASSDAEHKQQLSFDIASIREVKDPDRSFIDSLPSGGFWQAEGISLGSLIITAYHIRPVTLLKNLPDWAWSVRYNIVAKTDPSTDAALAKLTKSDFEEEKHHMLKKLLEERFGLQIHEETKTSVVYDLVANKRNSYLMLPVTDDTGKYASSCDEHFSRKGEEVNSKGCPFKFLFGTIQGELGTNVINKSGLLPSDLYAYHLMWDWQNAPPEDEADRFPHFRDALREQLGLELREGKGPVTFFIVDHVEHVSPN
jgi:uncharacterized protein (TIGR03435 family)